jgi:uncharacterized protein YgiM (DUF1202 family)
MAYLKILAVSFFILPQLLLAQTKEDAKLYANSTAYQLMKQISPLTGNNSYATTGKITFQKSTQRYSIEMTAFWSGKCCIICDATVFSISGVLTTDIYGRTPDFVITSNNDAVTTAMIVNELVAEGGRLALQELDKRLHSSKGLLKHEKKLLSFKEVISTSEIDIFSEPSTQSSLVGKISKGNKLKFVNTNGEYFFVLTNDNKVGFVLKDEF